MKKIYFLLICLISLFYFSCSEPNNNNAGNENKTSKVTFRNNQQNRITIVLINDEAEVYKNFGMTQNDEQVIAHFKNGHYKFKIGDVYGRYDEMPDLYISKDTVITITYVYPNFIATLN